MKFKIGNRNFSTLFSSVFEARHYKALFKMIRVYPDFLHCCIRYFFGNGSYPYVIQVRTPTGLKEITLYSYDDLLTVNEIFCRGDYYVSNDVAFVCDIGSNIGISALYFLTRNHYSYVNLFEPLPQNIERLEKNLYGYEDRYKLHDCAVGTENRNVEFYYEETGRYGGIDLKGMKNKISVQCKEINDTISEMIKECGSIDVLKLDVEGMELPIIQAIHENNIIKIKNIFAETDAPSFQLSNFFLQRQYGPILILENNSK
ncbi:MAG: FkbM family methyltransferase [Bacteroidota bacterium]|nr:FkbM family methyltransferase [Bacteroidota bacterium]